MIHAIELRPGGGAKIGRSAGSAVQLVAKDGPYAQLRMPSGEIRNVDVRCRATVGTVGNAEQSNRNYPWLKIKLHMFVLNVAANQPNGKVNARIV